MTSRYVRRIGVFVGGVAGLLLLFVIYEASNPSIFAVFRVGALLSAFLVWGRLVDALVSSGFIHPFRRTMAIEFRWRFLVLVALLELLVIQQLPSLVLDAFRI